MSARDKAIEMYTKAGGGRLRYLTHEEERRVRQVIEKAVAGWTEHELEVAGIEEPPCSIELEASSSGTSVAMFVIDGFGHRGKVAYTQIPLVEDNHPNAKSAFERIEGKAQETREILRELSEKAKRREIKEDVPYVDG